MPFKLKLKKSRHYNVMSKSLFVISVDHLDSSTKIDCTLSSESTGQECLENVCQRISINQPEFFGLRYLVKGTKDELGWVDLERPLNRQLEKYSANTKVLYLRVMYYVLSGVSLIKDEVTRNYYFLQLKHDVVEGRINCDPKQAVILGNYSRQAEYGNHQDRHTVEYLKTLLSFPKHLIKAGLLETLTEEVIHQHFELHNVTQGAAESLYISACQQLDGYGQETFTAKNESGNEVMLGISVSGIIVASDTNKFYPWRDIINVVNHKRAFNIECTVPTESVGFTVTDAATGRYIWKLCALQHTFFVSFEQNQTHASQVNLSLFQNMNDNLNDSRDDLLSEQQYQHHITPNWQQSDSHLSGTNNWPNPEQQMMMSSNSNISNNNMQSRSSLQTSALDINLNTLVPLDYSNHSSNWGLNPAGSNASLINRAQSSSCLDLSNNNVSQDRERLKALLPTYRPAPDYETAVQQKYRASSNDVRIPNGGNPTHLSASQMLSPEQQHIDYNITGSQPDVSYFNQQIQHQQLQQQQQQPYPDVTHHTTHIIGPHYSDASDYGLTHRFKMMRLIKPPPPYPANRLSSTSTPDLASHRALLGYRGAHVSGSSPDLVSTRPFVNPHQIMQLSQNNQIFYPAIAGPHLRHSQNIVPHGTYENLNFIEPTNTNLLPKHIQKAYDGSNVIYYVPRDVEHLLISDAPYQNGGHIGINPKPLLNRSSQHIHGSIEPIYENVPLPWKNENDSVGEMRNRTSSVQSAPGITRNVPTISNITPPSPTRQNPVFPQTENNNSHQIIGKTSSNPINNNNNQFESYKLNSSSTSSTLSINSPQAFNNESSAAANRSRLNTMNRSHSTNILDASQFSNYTVETNTTTDSGISSVTGSNVTTVSTTVVKEKRRKIWDILGGRSKNSSDKQKSATLGREKDRKNKNTSSSAALNDANIKHRWSTGLPRLQPLPANISKEKLCHLLESKLADTQLFYEFERIPKRGDNAKYDCALHDENKNKNFDPNFLPYDDNRVRLTPTRDNRMGYVNASHISSTVGNKQRFYIVAESPNDALTTNVFWQCVWEADVYLLVQLSTELNYIPQTSDRCLEYGQYQVWREFSQETDRCTTSKLRVYHTQSRRYRSVWHLSYTEWIEHNCPREVGHFLGFLEELNSVRLASISEVPPSHNTNPPVLIHCNEGGGRTGVTLVADLLLYTLDHNQDLDIPRLIGQLRQQRDNIIPSLAQYKFIYALLTHYLKQTRLI